jgi:hypothetical protein
MGKRHALGIRTTKQLKDLLQRAADSSGRSIAQEIEFRLEQSFERERTLADGMTDALGGPRTAALLRALAGQAQSWSGDDRWLDNHAGFSTVREMWQRTLDAMVPAIPGDVEAKHDIEKLARIADRLCSADLPDDLRNGMRAVIRLEFPPGSTPVPQAILAKLADALLLGTEEPR